jgi:hypothetical protein
MPSPAMVVALTALAVALSGTAYAATGGNLVLGQANTAGHVSALKNHNGAALALTSGGTGTPLTLTAPSGVAPLVVNSTTEVANLNADQLDGLSAADLQATAGSTGNSTGPLPQTISDVNFKAPASLLIVAGSGYRTSAGIIELQLYACPGVVAPCSPSTSGSVEIGSRDLYTNEANSHKPIDMTVATHLNGTYSLGLYPSADTKTDLTDQFSIVVVNLG